MATKKDELSTSQQIKPATIAASETSLEARWGDIILDAGHTSIPNLLLELYSELGISNDQMMLIIHIFNYRWTKKNPHPALSTIAAKMNINRRNCRRHISKLKSLTYQTEKEKEAGIEPTPFLVVKERYRTDSGQLSNLYDFSGLTAAVIKLALAKGIVADPASEADEDTPGVTNDLPPRSKKTYPPRSSMTHEEEISNKNQNNKKQFSNVRSDTVAKTQKEGNGGNGTYSHIAATAIGNGHKPVKPNTRTAKPTQPGKTGMTKLGDMLQDRLQDLMTQSTADPPKLPNGYTEEEDAIALYIEPYSRELGDEGHSKSNIRQAINIFTDIKSEIPELTVGQYLYILETFKDVVQYRRGVKNKMAYYFTCLRNHLWPQEHTQAKQGSLFN